jgi:ABC-2 type transport system ATP-binding protein
VRVLGKAPAGFEDADKARIGYIPQQFILYSHLSAEENLHFLGRLYGLPRRLRQARIDALLDFVDLGEARRRLGWQLSGGMKRRLMLAGALIHEPELIFADEPTSILLIGRSPGIAVWAGLAAIAIASYGLVLAATRRLLGRAIG